MRGQPLVCAGQDLSIVVTVAASDPRLSDGEWAGTGRENPYIFSGGKGIAHFSDQMYCPGSAAACVRDITTNSNDFCFQQ